MLDRGHYLCQPRALQPSELETLRQGILASPYLAQNPLNHYFETTLGYSVVFRRETIADVAARLPYVAPYLRRALSPMANAFYLNPLVIPEGGWVVRHADFSLRSHCPDLEPPNFVSVLYVSVPAGLGGGELRLFLGDDSCVGSIRPVVNTLVMFQGNLRHEVTPVRGCGTTPETSRISLVCEQYCLPASQLAAVPPLTLQSTAGFEAFLAGESAPRP